MDSYLIIVNPVSGKNNGSKVSKVIRDYVEANNLSYEIKFTKSQGDASIIATQEGSRHDFIIAVGGDGTLNEVVNGFNDYSKTLGLIPVGSGNDFARNLKLNSLSIEKILSIIFSKTPHIVKSNFGIIDYEVNNSKEIFSRKFINAVGIGIDSLVAKYNQDSKVFIGITSYLLAVLKALLVFKGVKMQIVTDNDQAYGNQLLTTIANSRTSGGGFYLNPYANINDDLLDVTTLEMESRIKILQYLPLALINKIEKIPNLKMFKTKSVEIKLLNPYFIHTDGEIISDSVTKLNIKLSKNKIKIISG